MNTFCELRTSFIVVVLAVMVAMGISACSSESDDPVAPCAQADTNPTITYWAFPVYPPEAIAQQIEGTVVVKVLVGVEGSAIRAEVIQSVHQLVDEAAIAAAMECVFVPGIRSCESADLWMALPFNFRIE